MTQQKLAASIVLGFLLSQPVTLFAQPDFMLIPRDPAFPDGVSPTHVYAKLVLVDEALQALVDHRGIKDLIFPQTTESGLQSMHVYQTVLSCTWRFQELADQDDIQVRHIPTISSDPREYHPRDVYFIVELMLANVQQIAAKLGVTLELKDRTFADKVAADVYEVAVRAFIKLNYLCGYEDLTPSEVYAQMARAVQDVKSMLQQQDPRSRYRINSPVSEPDRTPGHVFAECLEIRKKLNEIRTAFNREPIHIPTPPPLQDIFPRDVFFQTQIIIAELNLLKKPLNTKSSSPLPVPVLGKTPDDVHSKASMILYLLGQVNTE